MSPCACHEGIWGSENFISYLIYSWGKRAQYGLNMVLGLLVWTFWRREIFLALATNEQMMFCNQCSLKFSE